MKASNPNKSLLKVLSIIKCFNSKELELGSTDISKKLCLPLTTTYRILSTLTKGEFLDQNLKTGKYRISPLFYSLGKLYLNTTDITKATEPVTEMLSELTKEGMSVGILNKGTMIVVIRSESKYPFRITDHIGSTCPAYASAVGKVLLSDLNETEIDELYPQGRTTIANR